MATFFKSLPITFYTTCKTLDAKRGEQSGQEQHYKWDWVEMHSRQKNETTLEKKEITKWTHPDYFKMQSKLSQNSVKIKSKFS